MSPNKTPIEIIKEGAFGGNEYCGGAEYYEQNEKAIKEKSRQRYKNLPQEKKDKIKEYQRKKYQELVQYKKKALKNK